MTIRTAPPAPSFPADWNVIAAPGAPFSNDPMHFPFPVSPLMASTQTAFAAGYLAAAREIGLPITEVQVRDINHCR
jgi:hypothetical protein